MTRGWHGGISHRLSRESGKPVGLFEPGFRAICGPPAFAGVTNGSVRVGSVTGANALLPLSAVEVRVDGADRGHGLVHFIVADLPTFDFTL